MWWNAASAQRFKSIKTTDLFLEHVKEAVVRSGQLKACEVKTIKTNSNFCDMRIAKFDIAITIHLEFTEAETSTFSTVLGIYVGVEFNSSIFLT